MPELADLEFFARQAGEILRAGYGQHHHVEYKGTIDIVTETDRRSENYLLSEIRRRFPDHRIIAEESGEVAGRDCCVWYVDPLDGTVNFAHGVPIFSVSIAYGEGGQTRLGVVYDPTRDECFSAQSDCGAWLNGEPISCSQISTLDQSLLVTGFPYDVRTRPDNNLDHFHFFSLHTQAVRRLGSAALDMCYVASGRMDGFWEISLNPWDVGAGDLIAREAGAIVTSLRGEPLSLDPPVSVLAAAPGIHGAMAHYFSQK
jgi:myo-inositol-1(or 4)-monophosphatase